MKTLAIIIVSILASCASAPQPQIPQAAPQPTPTKPGFFDLYLGPFAEKGFVDDVQQAAIIAYSCTRIFEFYYDDSIAVYGTPEQCRERKAAAYQWAKQKISVIATVQNASETVGYHCMDQALEKWCVNKLEFCIWDSVRSEYNECLGKY